MLQIEVQGNFLIRLKLQRGKVKFVLNYYLLSIVNFCFTGKKKLLEAYSIQGLHASETSKCRRNFTVKSTTVHVNLLKFDQITKFWG